MELVKMNGTSSQRMAVLQTGRSVPGSEERHGDYDDMCKALMGRAPDDADTFAILDGEFPDDITEYDVFVVTGSKFGVYEDHAWIAPLEELIRQIYDSGKKMVGVCFGHQIIAQALGGEVEKSDKGFGAGAMHYTLQGANGQTQDIALYAWHQDQVIRAPAQAETIASSDFCPIAGLRYGDRVLTFQAHPEFTKAYTEELAEARRGIVLTDEQADQALASLKTKINADLIQEMIFEFISD
ncbi:MAG: type 1 glutamine amidotransferase [Pseudomonadota bacterium]